jgi:hypothetical protein
MISKAPIWCHPLQVLSFITIDHEIRDVHRFRTADEFHKFLPQWSIRPITQCNGVQLLSKAWKLTITILWRIQDNCNIWLKRATNLSLSTRNQNLYIDWGGPLSRKLGSPWGEGCKSENFSGLSQSPNLRLRERPGTNYDDQLYVQIMTTDYGAPATRATSWEKGRKWFKIAHIPGPFRKAREGPESGHARRPGRSIIYVINRNSFKYQINNNWAIRDHNIIGK